MKSRKVPAGTPGARKVKKKSSKWYGRVSGNPKPFPLSSNKVAAQQMLAALVKKAELKKANVFDPFEDHARRPLVEHLEDYRRFLEAEGNCAEYVTKTYARIRAFWLDVSLCLLLILCRKRFQSSCTDCAVTRRAPCLGSGSGVVYTARAGRGSGRGPSASSGPAAAPQRLAVEGTGRARRYPRATVEALQDLVLRGIGISTSNGYLTAIKGFSRWLAGDRTDRDRLASLSRLNAATDLRHERRELPEMELRSLLAAAATNATEFQGLTGTDRRMLYAVAMTTGYRAQELASLAPAAFRLDSDPPTIRVRAGYSKNRKESEQPLPADVARALDGYLRRPTGSSCGLAGALV